MRKILISCINFNSYKELDVYLQSIDNAAKLTLDSLKVDVVVADNTVENYEVINTSYPNINVHTFPFHENFGYIGGATKMFELLGEERLKSYDYLIISNVDLTLDESFFSRLLEQDIANDCGWIAPAILSKQENRDRNPKILKRYSLKTLKVLQLMYRIPILHYLYNALIYKKRKEQKGRKEQGASEIYAGHGSLMIFTKAYVEKRGIISYPCFLFGEEIYFAEELASYNLVCCYRPEVICYDDDHVSTSKMKRKIYYKSNYDALTYIIKTYYK